MIHSPQDDDLTYEGLKALGKQLGRPLESMYALSGSNDPFTTDMPRRREAAEWFAGFWRQFATEDSKLHVRRIHYRLISSTRPLVRPNGEPYINTEACWDWLCNAGRDARYLDLIPPGSIIDRRNPEPAIFLVDVAEAAITIAGGLDDLVVPSFTTPRLYLVKPTILHRYLVEIWCEKSTINDTLMPLGERYGVNVITGVGEMSATRVEQLIERIRRDEKGWGDVIAAQRRVYARHAETIAQVEADHAELLTNIAELRERIAELQSEFEESAQPVFDAVEADLAAELPSADDYRWPEPKDGDEDDDPLYDSSRDYFEQLARYREHQGKPEDAGFKLYDLTCAGCGKPFQSRRPHAETCSKACRNRKYRQRGATW
jgi:hypothetical protein